MTNKIKALLVAGIGGLLFLFLLPFIMLFMIMFAWLIVPILLIFFIIVVSYAFYKTSLEVLGDQDA